MKGQPPAFFYTKHLLHTLTLVNTPWTPELDSRVVLLGYWTLAPDHRKKTQSEPWMDLCTRDGAQDSGNYLY